jgi:hypothetical protein
MMMSRSTFMWRSSVPISPVWYTRRDSNPQAPGSKPGRFANFRYSCVCVLWSATRFPPGLVTGLSLVRCEHTSWAAPDSNRETGSFELPRYANSRQQPALQVLPCEAPPI